MADWLGLQGWSTGDVLALLGIVATIVVAVVGPIRKSLVRLVKAGALHAGSGERSYAKWFIGQWGVYENPYLDDPTCSWRGRATRRRSSGSWPATARCCSRTATAWSARCPMPRTPCRKLWCGPGGTSIPSAVTPAWAAGCTASPQTSA